MFSPGEGAMWKLAADGELVRQNVRGSSVLEQHRHGGVCFGRHTMYVADGGVFEVVHGHGRPPRLLEGVVGYGHANVVEEEAFHVG